MDAVVRGYQTIPESVFFDNEVMQTAALRFETEYNRNGPLWIGIEISTRLPRSARYRERVRVVVVFATPPRWLDITNLSINLSSLESTDLINIVGGPYPVAVGRIPNRFRDFPHPKPIFECRLRDPQSCSYLC